MQHDGNGLTFSNKVKQQQSVSRRGFASKRKKRWHSIVECRVESSRVSSRVESIVESIVESSRSSSVESIIESIVERTQHDGISKKGKTTMKCKQERLCFKKKKWRHSIIECRVESIVESIDNRTQHDGNGLTFSKKEKQQQSVSGRKLVSKGDDEDDRHRQSGRALWVYVPAMVDLLCT